MMEPLIVVTDMASDVIEWLFTCDEVTYMTEWVLSLGSIMDVDESDSTFSVRNSEGILRTMPSLVESKRVELSLQKKCRKKALEKTADPAMKDCTNSLNQSCFCTSSEFSGT